MYIPIWFIVLIAMLGVLIGFIHYTQNTPQSKIKRLEKVIDFTYSGILEPPYDELLAPETDQFVGALRRTERMYVVLRSHYDEDWNKQLELVNDWYDYCNSISELKSAFIIYTVDYEDDTLKRYEESVRWPLIKKEEIESKFKILLKGLRYAD